MITETDPKKFTLADFNLGVSFSRAILLENGNGTFGQCVQWRATFHKVNSTGECGPTVAFEYFCGIGNYPDLQKFLKKHDRPSYALGFILKRLKAPNPVEILNCIARDSQAMDQTFEEWASDFGYDTDSRKAEAIYRACIDGGRKLALILTPAQISQLAALEF